MGAGGKRNSRRLIFLAVVVLHGALVLLLLRATHQFQTPTHAAVEPLVFLSLHSREQPQVSKAATEKPLNSKAHERKPPQPPAVSLEATTPQNMPPPNEAARDVDWQREIELAAQNSIVNAQHAGDYRNLGGLSDAQLKWVRDNHMVPMEPGMVWAHPRIEIDKATLLPIVHINDHCVLVLVFVFCSVGHITPNSHLLDHMHDAPAQ